jgi:sulfonate transport system substrate-binding protein
VTKGTDPYFFLLQSLAKAGVNISTVKLQNLQHAAGKTALENGSVDAHGQGLDRLLSTSVASGSSRSSTTVSELQQLQVSQRHRNFLSKSPDLAQVVVNAYEARAYAIKNQPRQVQSSQNRGH